jgi:hypothetical protein
MSSFKVNILHAFLCLLCINIFVAFVFAKLNDKFAIVYLFSNKNEMISHQQTTVNCIQLISETLCLGYCG